VANAADEELVAAFLAGKIHFTAIAEGLRSVLERHVPMRSPSLGDILAADSWARAETHRWMTQRFGPTIGHERRVDESDDG
jgi:1-deoxy-D-xylulose-5-phosphate reductoisomerase